MKKIIHLSHRPCARVLKTGLTTRRLGYAVEFWQQTAREDFLPRFKHTQFFSDGDDLVERLHEAKPDLVYVHVCGAPELAALAKAGAGRRPVLCDIHDLDIMRFNTTSAYEESVFAIADALVFSSAGYETLCRRWKPAQVSVLPQAVVPPAMLPEDILGINQLPRRPGLVYQGGISRNMPHRRMTGIVKRATEAGISVVVYAANGSAADKSALMNAGATVVTGYYYRPMLNELTRYDFGLCGCDEKNRALQQSGPNKFFEYAAAGTPIVTVNAGNQLRLAEGLNVGVNVADIADIKNIDPRQFDGFRLVPTMLDYQGRLKELYQQLLS